MIALDGIETSKGIWDKLKSLYQSNGPTRKTSLLKKLVLTRMQEEDDLKKHLGAFFDTVKKLKEINLVAIDELLAILLLYSFPDSFSMLRTAMESQDELPSTEILKIKIIENYEGRKSRDVNTDQGAMYLKKQQVTRTQTSENQKSDNHHYSDSRRYRNKVECYRCGRVSHITRDCRSKYPANKSKQSAKQLDDQDSESKNKQEIKKNALLITSFSTADETMYSRDSSDNNGKWCIDSGCTGHMCNERNMFKNFTRLDSELNLANNESTRITAKGSVSLAVDTDNCESIIDIEKVFYVSDLRTNLLSVSKITDRGFEVIFRKKDAIVLDKNKDVLLRADRVGNLYCERKSRNTP